MGEVVERKFVIYRRGGVARGAFALVTQNDHYDYSCSVVDAFSGCQVGRCCKGRTVVSALYGAVVAASWGDGSGVVVA